MDDHYQKGADVGADVDANEAIKKAVDVGDEESAIDFSVYNWC